MERAVRRMLVGFIWLDAKIQKYKEMEKTSPD